MVTYKRKLHRKGAPEIWIVVPFKSLAKLYTHIYIYSTRLLKPSINYTHNTYTAQGLSRPSRESMIEL